MNNGSGVSRGDRNRNARLSLLRGAVPVRNAIVGIDLADRKQMVVVTDHPGRVTQPVTYPCSSPGPSPVTARALSAFDSEADQVLAGSGLGEASGPVEVVRVGHLHGLK